MHLVKHVKERLIWEVWLSLRNEDTISMSLVTVVIVSLKSIKGLSLTIEARL